MNVNDYKKLICENFCAHAGERREYCKDCCLDPTLLNCFELRLDAEKLMEQHVLSNGEVLLKSFYREMLDDMMKRFGIDGRSGEDVRKQIKEIF